MKYNRQLWISNNGNISLFSVAYLINITLILPIIDVLMLFFKKNKMFIIITLLLLGWIIICGLQYKKDLLEKERRFNEAVEECNNSEEKWCEGLKNQKFVAPDTLTIYFYIISNYSISYIQWLAPLFIITATVWLWHKKMHSGFIKDELIRSDYKKVLRKNLLTSIKSCMILPFVFLVLFGLCYLISGHFNITDSQQVGINIEFLDNIPKLMFIYFIVIFLHSIFYACLGLLFCKKSKNILITIVSAYLCFLMIDIVSEIFIGGLLLPILGFSNFSSIFNLLGIWIYCDYPNYSSILVLSTVIAILSIIVLVFAYRDKEEVLLRIEKQC